ncbi:MAG: GGDEF domain-containing protein [Spirochaetaceae bacterium]|nr:GGDEF domain-containing protein [Spirochaetaceae bacterium]
MDTEAAQPAEQRLDSAFLERFKLLDQSGALEDLAKLRRENRELDALATDAASLFVLSSIEAMIEFVIARLVERFVPSNLLFLIENPRDRRLRQYRYRGVERIEEDFPREAYAALRRRFQASPFMVSFRELAEEDSMAAFAEAAASLEPELALPMRGIEGLFGAVILGGKIIGGEYSELERMYVDRIVRFLSIGIQNGLHYESAITDPKTGLYNHPHFMRRLEEEQSRAARRGIRSGVIMLDVDRFKLFNDTHGHLAGDAVLNAMAETIHAAIRGEDVAARFGGEEFCVLVMECDELALLEVAERIRVAIEELVVPFEGRELRITASVGCCLISGLRGVDAEAYIDRADKALYLSKSGGRNRTTLHRAGLLDRASLLRARASRPEGPQPERAAEPPKP